MNKEDNFLTIKEVADKLNVSKMTIYRVIKAGDLKAIDIGTGARRVYRVSQKELNKFIEKQKTE